VLLVPTPPALTVAEKQITVAAATATAGSLTQRLINA